MYHLKTFLFQNVTGNLLVNNPLKIDYIDLGVILLTTSSKWIFLAQKQFICQLFDPFFVRFCVKGSIYSGLRFKNIIS